MLPGQPPVDIMQSTPMPVAQHSFTIPPTHIPQTIFVQPPPVLSEKAIKHFSGFMHEDAAKFLSEFESYLLLSAIDASSPRAIAAFHLHLQGPAVIWFNNLTVKDSWDNVKKAFLSEYCDS